MEVDGFRVRSAELVLEGVFVVELDGEDAFLFLDISIRSKEKHFIGAVVVAKVSSGEQES